MGQRNSSVVDVVSTVEIQFGVFIGDVNTRDSYRRVLVPSTLQPAKVLIDVSNLDLGCLVPQRVVEIARQALQQSFGGLVGIRKRAFVKRVRAVSVLEEFNVRLGTPIPPIPADPEEAAARRPIVSDRTGKRVVVVYADDRLAIKRLFYNMTFALYGSQPPLASESFYLDDNTTNPDFRTPVDVNWTSDEDLMFDVDDYGVKAADAEEVSPARKLEDAKEERDREESLSPAARGRRARLQLQTGEGSGGARKSVLDRLRPIAKSLGLQDVDAGQLISMLGSTIVSPPSS